MARQDYAQVKAPRKTDSGSGSGSLLTVVAILLIVGTSFTAGYWLGSGNVQQTGTDVDKVEAKLAVKDAEAKLQQARIESLEELVETWKKKAEQDAYSKVGELDFYKKLPKQSVTPAPISTLPVTKKVSRSIVKSVVTPQTAKTNGQGKTNPVQHAGKQSYRIQLASFRTRSDAMNMQHKLSQAGFPSLIHMVELGERGQWYRVYAGPYSSKQAAETSQQKIEQKMKLKGLLVRGG